MTTQLNWDELRDAALADNTAQGILKYLRELKSNRAAMGTRWIWELFQNARDASIDADTPLIVSVEHEPEDIIFRHNGRGFTAREITHLIHHGSTKVETDEAIGKFGSGFLTTHLLSSEINVSGQLDMGRPFEFRLKRDDSSVAELRDCMDESWKDFKRSLSSVRTQLLPSNFTTQFQYPILDGVNDVVNEGLTMLKRCAPFVIVFNKEFSYIDVKTSNGIRSFKVAKRTQLSPVGWEIRVSENENGNWKDKVYLLAEGEETSVAIPLEDDGQACLLVNNIPRLFLGFPLVGTEEFSFPAIINSFSFSPTENRDGVYLGQENDEANSKNKAVIEEACELLVGLLDVAASAGWRNIYALADIPQVNEPNQKKKQWIQGCLNKQLIEKIRQTSAVLNEAGKKIPSDEFKLPFAETTTGIETLWDLLDGGQGCREILPRQNETIGWWNAVKSWTDICGSDKTSFDEVIDGDKLALLIQDKTNNVKSLQDFLRDDICAIEWLDRFYSFLREDGQYEAVRTYSIIPNQSGKLDKLSNLYRDQNIDEELKDIAELLGYNIRQELRDKRLYSLVNEVGAGDRTKGDVVQKLITKLREHVGKDAKKDLDDNFKKASVRLFAWLVNQEDWSRLQGFPVFATDGNSILDLPTAHGGEPPLAPVSAWSEGLEQFANLFPPDRILADDFFEAVRDPGVWEQLDEQKPRLIRRSMITTRKETVNFKEFFPEEELPEGNHKTVDCISVIDVVERVKIMDRVSDSQDRAHRFWQFLTDWLIKEDVQSLETKKTKCECGEIHEYYPAAWVMPVRNNRWIRLPKDKWASADAQSLASLFRDNGWNPSSIDENSAAVGLLKAIGVSLSDLKLEFITENSEQRNELVNTMTELHQAIGGDLSQIRTVVRHMQDNEDLSQNLEKLLKATEGDLSQVLEYAEERQNRQRRGYENQRLGSKVEKLVKAILEKKGFSVERTGIGSDFEISEDITTLDIVQDDQSWLIEVKSTQTENAHQSVRMSSKQAQTAVKKRGEFLLCIVPIGSENTEPDLETVKGNMRFIKNIHQKLGSRVATLCESIEEQEEVLSNTPDDTSSGVDLDFEAGKAGIRVANFVWEDEGFQLENLAEQLKQVKTT